MKKKFKALSILALCFMLLAGSIPTFASESSAGDNARGTYISSSKAYATVSGSTVKGRAIVSCFEEMSSITTIIYLQKSTSSGWSSISNISVTEKDSPDLDQTATFSNVSSGTYRIKTSTIAKPYSGSSESIVATTGSFTVS